MKLKSVEIKGFKSFADEITLEFHDGITCIVGPNGCGKSNIGDAIRWVLGEQSAKAIRGGKMPDVIFGGTQSREPLDRAEVTLTLSEISGALPVPYDEVSITRRLYSSGDSEYLINRQPARLKDVNFLFLDSGVGKNNFSFFEQGKMDQMIQYSSKERRGIFEEAAGIQRFLQRKKETLRKLEDVSLNVTRLEDIYREVEQQILHLEAQSETARIYKEKKGRLAFLEKGILASRYESYAKKKRDLKGKEADVQGEKGEWSQKKESLELACQTARKRVSEKEEEYLQGRDALLRKQGERELKKQRQSYTEEKKRECQAKRQKGEKELHALEAELQKGAHELESLKQQKEALQAPLNEAQSTYKKVEEELQELEQEIQQARSKQSESHHERISALQKEAALENEKKQIAFRLQSHLEKEEHLEERRKNLSLLISEKEAEVEDKKGRLEAASEKVLQSKTSLAESDRKLQASNEALEAFSESFDALSKQVDEMAAKLKALLQLKKEFSGFTGGGKKLLQMGADSSHPLFGMIKGLYEYFTPAPGSEKAISSLLRGYSQTLAVETVSDLQEVLKIAHEKGITDFSMVCLELLPSDQKSSNPLFVHEANRVSRHFLKDIATAPDLDSILSRKVVTSLWSESGFHVDAKGVFFVGGEDKGSLFSQELEIKSLAVSLKEREQEREGAAEALAELKNERLKWQEERARADLDVRKREMEGIEVQFAFQKAQGELQRVKKETDQVTEELLALQGQIAALREQQEKAEAKLAEAKAFVDQIQSRSQVVEFHLKEKNQKWTYQKQALREKNEVLIGLEGEFRKTSHALNLLEVKLGETEKQSSRIDAEMAQVHSEEKELALDADAVQADFAALEKHLLDMEGRVQDLASAVQSSKKELKILENEKKVASDKETELAGQLHQIGIQLAHVETGQSSLDLEIQERFEEKGEDLLFKGFKLDIGLERAEKEVKQLKELIASYGNVNLAAIEECEKQMERRSFLKTQKEDLTSSRDELLSLIRELDSESKKLFRTTFEAIRLHFQKNFQILFKGGEADLELVDSTDVLEAGIEITAKPPGKQMRYLSLLSGGEKCLTAMALLFALFEVKSSPFCILDEVDAPLDDANIERFLNVVKAFADRSQFVIITHNKRTMSLADRLYGVSMEEKGVSKLLSMEFAGSQKLVRV